MDSVIKIQENSIWVGISSSDKGIVAIAEKSELGHCTNNVELKLIEISSGKCAKGGLSHSYLLKNYLPLFQYLKGEYVKGKADGYNEGYQQGFTLAKEKITELDEQERQKIYDNAYEDGKSFGINLGKNGAIFQKQWVENIKRQEFNKGFAKGSDHVREHFKQQQEMQHNREEEIQNLAFNDGYQRGYEDCNEKIHSVMAERELAIKKKACEEGFLAAVEEITKPCEGKENPKERKHSHYFKDTSEFDEIDTYLLARIWNIVDENGALLHSLKKILDAGKRGAGKDKLKDISEARDSLNRYLEIEELFQGKDNA